MIKQYREASTTYRTMASILEIHQKIGIKILPFGQRSSALCTELRRKLELLGNLTFHSEPNIRGGESRVLSRLVQTKEHSLCCIFADEDSDEKKIKSAAEANQANGALILFFVCSDQARMAQPQDSQLVYKLCQLGTTFTYFSEEFYVVDEFIHDLLESIMKLPSHDSLYWGDVLSIFDNKGFGYLISSKNAIESEVVFKIEQRLKYLPTAAKTALSSLAFLKMPQFSGKLTKNVMLAIRSKCSESASIAMMYGVGGATEVKVNFAIVFPTTIDAIGATQINN
ncbi:MAG: hypothetical protein NVS3B3_11380 [Aquirhabdus sp.]